MGTDVENFLDMAKLQKEAIKFGFKITKNGSSIFLKCKSNNQILVVDRISKVDEINGMDPTKTFRLYSYYFTLKKYCVFIEYWVNGDLLTKYIIETCFPILMGITNINLNEKDLVIKAITDILNNLGVKYVLNNSKKYKKNLYICNYDTHNNSNYYVEKSDCTAFDFCIY